MEVFVEECFGGKVFFGRKGIEFPDFWGERVSEINLVVIRSGRRDVVRSFFSEDQGKLGVFGGKSGFGFSRFCGCGKFCSGGEVGDYWGSHGNKTGAASDDSMEGSVFVGSIDVGGVFLPLVKFNKVGIGDGIYVDVVGRASGRFKERVVSFVVDFVRGKEEFGFVNGEGSGSPIDDRVGSP